MSPSMHTYSVLIYIYFLLWLSLYLMYVCTCIYFSFSSVTYGFDHNPLLRASHNTVNTKITRLSTQPYCLRWLLYMHWNGINAILMYITKIAWGEYLTWLSMTCIQLNHKTIIVLSPIRTYHVHTYVFFQQVEHFQHWATTLLPTYQRENLLQLKVPSVGLNIHIYIIHVIICFIPILTTPPWLPVILVVKYTISMIEAQRGVTSCWAGLTAVFDLRSLIMTS